MKDIIMHIMQVSKSTPRFLTDEEDLSEQPSSVKQNSRLLREKDFCPIIRISVVVVFQN